MKHFPCYTLICCFDCFDSSILSTGDLFTCVFIHPPQHNHPYHEEHCNRHYACLWAMGDKANNAIEQRRKDTSKFLAETVQTEKFTGFGKWRQPSTDF